MSNNIVKYPLSVLDNLEEFAQRKSLVEPRAQAPVECERVPLVAKRPMCAEIDHQVEIHSAVMKARDNTFILQGMLNELTRSIHEKLDGLNRKIDMLAVKIDTLVADE